MLTGMVVLISMGGCVADPKTEVEDQKSPTAAILGQMAEQEEAWNRGDLEAFMLPYWKSDSLLFIGSRGPSYGWETTLANYKKGYPTAEAMGTLTFDVSQLDVLSNDVALVVGAWHLGERGGLEDLSGWFSLVWRQFDGHWVIVRDHSS